MGDVGDGASRHTGVTAVSGKRFAPNNRAGIADPTLEPLPAAGKGRLGTARRVGWVVFGVQLAGFVTWSTIVWQRFALTYDFWLVSQASYKVNHTGVAGGWQVITGYFDAVITWIFALLIRLPTHGLTLLWAQDLALVGVGLVGFLWVCELLERRPIQTGIPAHWLALLALVFFVGNPWIFKTVAFDFHVEVFGTLFILLAARELQRGRIRRSMVWIAATVACGFVAATYVGGLALSALVAGRGRQRLAGAGLLVAGVAGVIVLTSAGGAAAVVSFYSYLVPHAGTHLSFAGLVSGIAAHPTMTLRTLWANRIDMVAILAPVGMLGLAWGWGFGVPLVVLLGDALQFNNGLRVPSFQSLPVYTFVAVGTVMLIARLSQANLELSGGRVRIYENGSPVIWALSGFLALDTVAWAITYTPQISDTYLSVSSESAMVLSRVEAKIPQNAEVIASQGIIGRFSYRQYSWPIWSFGQVIPLKTRTVWLVVTPHQGIKTVPAKVELSILDEVRSEGAHLVLASHGVWAYQWSPPNGINTLVVPARGAQGRRPES